MAANKRTDLAHFTCYTDGSLLNPDASAIMGAGWVFVGSHTEDARGCVGLRNWPSSTKAKLTAILMALCSVPSNSRCSIYTDSQAAIDGIKQLMSLGDSWKWNKLSNNNIKAAIRLLYGLKNISVDLIKMKEHSNDTYNDIADLLAKRRASEGSEGDFLFDLNSFTFSLISSSVIVIL